MAKGAKMMRGSDARRGSFCNKIWLQRANNGEKGSAASSSSNIHTPRKREREGLVYDVCTRLGPATSGRKTFFFFHHFFVLCPSSSSTRRQARRSLLHLLLLVWGLGLGRLGLVAKKREKGKSSRDRDTSVVVRYGSHRNFFVVNEAKRKDTHTQQRRNVFWRYNKFATVHRSLARQKRKSRACVCGKGNLNPVLLLWPSPLFPPLQMRSFTQTHALFSFFPWQQLNRVCQVLVLQVRFSVQKYPQCVRVFRICVFVVIQKVAHNRKCACVCACDLEKCM